MREIYSKTNPGTLLHMICRGDEVTSNRADNSTPPEQFLQASAFTMPKDKTFRPHKHLTQVRTTDITQESWIVIRGAVEATLYDLDDTVLEQVVLQAGDCSMTFKGGHNYKSLQDNTLIYEYKTGPYQGQEKDKTFIDDPTIK